MLHSPTRLYDTRVHVCCACTCPLALLCAWVGEQAGNHVGNFSSSLSHSCSSNCTTATAVRNGKLCVTLTTKRAIAYGKKQERRKERRERAGWGGEGRRKSWRMRGGGEIKSLKVFVPESSSCIQV